MSDDTNEKDDQQLFEHLSNSRTIVVHICGEIIAACGFERYEHVGIQKVKAKESGVGGEQGSTKDKGDKGKAVVNPEGGIEFEEMKERKLKHWSNMDLPATGKKTTPVTMISFELTSFFSEGVAEKLPARRPYTPFGSLGSPQIGRKRFLSFATTPDS